jgi:hypothetical protein
MVPERLRTWVGRNALRVARRCNRRTYLELDYAPTADNRPRWGYGRPLNEHLVRVLERHESRYGKWLEITVGYADELLRVPRRPTAPGEPYWLSAWLPGLDAATLYAFVRTTAPRRYIEVGSGVSTTFVHRARVDGGLDTRITSIDPEPRAEIDALCDEVVRQPLETIDVAFFQQLEAGDMLFVDNSHRVFMNSDVVAFFLDILPSLRPGVLVGVHDILLPADYLPMWAPWWFSEQYVMGALLLGEPRWLQPELASSYATLDENLSRIVAPLFDQPHLADVDRRGFGFWMTTTGSALAQA